MNIDFLILTNNQAMFAEAADNIHKQFGVMSVPLFGASSIASGYNRLAKESKADILCFMHHDCRLEFGFDVIESYFKELKNPGVLGFCGSAQHVPGKQWHECPPLYGGLYQGRPNEGKPLVFNDAKSILFRSRLRFQPVHTLDGYCLFIKRDVFEKIGGFDESYAGWHGYDMDICAKALSAGYQNYVIDQPSQHFSWGSSGPDLTAALARFKEKWGAYFSAIAPKPIARVLPGYLDKKQGKLKIVVYTICKNERQFVERFVETCKDADGIYVLDTGSTDGTPEALSALGVNVEVKPFDTWQTLEEYDRLCAEGKNPWRFDTARNLSIDMCPEDADVLICIDMDEVLVKDWRKIVEAAWTPGVNHMSYLFSWSMSAPYPNGKPVNPFWYEKFHSRHGYVWAQPVHEQLCSESGFQDVRAWVKQCLVHHYADQSKSRAQYLPLLELSVREAPHAVLARFYLGREYSFKGRYDDCINSHKHLLSMPDCKDARTRGNACSQIAACYGAKKDGVSMPRSYIDGLELSNNAGAPNTTVDIAPGECRSLADDSDLVYNGMIKVLNVVFAEGSGQGGLDTGSVNPNTWYYVWAIKRSDNGTVDFLFSTSSTDPVMPSAYDSKHCIGMIKTDGSSNIIPFDQHDDVFMWVTQVTEVNAAAGPAVETLLELNGIPSGFDVKALLRITATSATPGDDYYVRPTFQTSGYGAYVVCQVASLINSTSEVAVVQAINGRVNHKATDADVTVSLYTNGWIFNRGRNS